MADDEKEFSRLFIIEDSKAKTKILAATFKLVFTSPKTVALIFSLSNKLLKCF